ncbi:MAG: gephyrin-like molybdotransferase Glp [Candidatus Eisenbacteria bacterium]
MSVPEPRFLSYAQARERVLHSITPLAAEMQPLVIAQGRALRRTLFAPHGLPMFRNSAMDGFAVRAADLADASEAQPLTLPVHEAIPAGITPTRTLRTGEAVRIMTGAEVPEGADTVVPFEDCERSQPGHSPEQVVFRRPVTCGDNVRLAGVDIMAGGRVMEEGRELSAHDLALLGSLGFAQLPVSPQLRVAVLSTGDELLDLDEPLRPGAIRDSNLPMLSMLCEQAGALVVVAERLPDDPKRVGDRIREALAVADAVLTIGGVSAGDHDPVKQALARLEGIELWRVAMRPGRPQAFGMPQGRIFFGLPGNPASVACVFEALVRPALRRLSGYAMLDRPHVPVCLTEGVESRDGRVDFVRTLLEWRDGRLWATPAGLQVSGHLTPQSRAHALLVVPAQAERLAAGDTAQALVLRLPDIAESV